mgnify:FL=1
MKFNATIRDLVYGYWNMRISEIRQTELSDDHKLSFNIFCVAARVGEICLKCFSFKLSLDVDAHNPLCKKACLAKEFYEIIEDPIDARKQIRCLVCHTFLSITGADDDAKQAAITAINNHCLKHTDMQWLVAGYYRVYLSKTLNLHKKIPVIA